MRTLSFIQFFAFATLSLYLTSCKKDTVTNSNSDPGTTVTDIDGNVYKTVKIGSQVWMAENLKVSRYNNGDSISNLKDGWGQATGGAWCHYGNTPAIEAEYGKLYNWYTIFDSRKLAPKGWHIPSAQEYKTLIDYLGPDSAGSKLKETGEFHWFSNFAATNSSGFTARPGGLRNWQQGYFSNISSWGYFWSSTLATDNIANFLQLQSSSIQASISATYTTHGMSVRCIKD